MRRHSHLKGRSTTLTVTHVSKSYTNVQAVSDLSFSVKGGEILGLIGPNGAGKTTTIRMIMNIIAPDTGTILFNGRPICDMDKDHISYLPEERGLYRKAKLGETLEYLAAIKGVSHQISRPLIESWLERFELSEWKDRKVSQLSKGMAQKAQFIATVINNPSMVFFDEPFSGLDPITQDQLLSVMVELKQKGVAVLFSTHILEHAERICERILLMHKGSAVAYDTLSNIKSAYGSNTVHLEFDGDASFIQSLEFVNSVVPYPRWLEVELHDNADADRLFRALAGKVKVRRFEVVEPSLHKIFIRLVGGEVGDVI